MILQFNYNDELIDVVINKKDIKNIYIKLNSNNDIIVSAPKEATADFIITFVNGYLEKFIKQQKINLKKKYIDLDEQTFYLFGNLEKYELIEKTNVKNELIKYLVYGFNEYKINKKSITEIIFKIYKKELSWYLEFYQPEMERMMGVEHHEFSIRKKQTAWASNYVKIKKINYSTKLASYSPEIINYVIIHELCHQEHSNHSFEFWEKVRKYDINFEDKKKKLKSFIYF